MNIAEIQKDLIGSILLLKDFGKEESTCVITGFKDEYLIEIFVLEENKFLVHGFTRVEFRRFLKKERIYGEGYFKAFYIEIID